MSGKSKKHKAMAENEKISVSVFGLFTFSLLVISRTLDYIWIKLRHDICFIAVKESSKGDNIRRKKVNLL